MHTDHTSRSIGLDGTGVRVAQIAAPLVDAGVARHVLELASHLPPRIEVRLVLPDRPALTPALRRGHERGLPIRLVSDWRRRTHEQHADWLTQLDVHLVHLHFSTPFDLVPVLEAAAACNLRTITTDHMVAGGPWGEGTPEEIDRRRHAARQVACSIADSAAVRDGLVHAIGLPPDSVRVIHHGIDTARFTPGDRYQARRRLGLPLDRTLLGAAGLLVSAKGVDRVIAALGDLPDDVQLCVLGDGPERPRLVALAGRFGDRVRFHGWRDDLPLWYRAVDVFVHAADTEGFPSVLLEAMASGCPIVATAVGGVPELLADGARGSLVPDPAPATLAAAIRGRLGHPTHATTTTALRDLRERFSIRRTAQQVAALYEDVRHDLQS